MPKKVIFEDIDEITENDNEPVIFLKKRLIGAALIILIFFGLIMARLWFLQVLHGEEYRQRAYNNRVRIRKIAAPRGHIVDRYGRELVVNRPSFNVVLIREDSYDIDQVLKRLSEVLEVDVARFWKRIREAEASPRHIPITLADDIDWKTLSYLENHNRDFPGIRIEVQPVRVYPYHDLASHAIGYIGVIDQKELAAADREIYDGGDLIGKTGLEKIREQDLRGEKGHSSSEVNVRGFEQQILTELEPMPGSEIMLTIDAELQLVAETMMEIGDRSGAVVAMEVNTGRVLAAASAPAIHLEQFVGGISTKNWLAMAENDKHPMLNKAVQSAYPPGSTYKMITAVAGLVTGVITPETKVNCRGHYRFGNRKYKCWKKQGHGQVDLKKAITESCDIYFYQVGQKIGVDKLAEFAAMFGLGRKTGIELEHEKSGTVPTKKWKRKKFGSKWNEGDTLSAAIGQGHNTATPLQICLMTSVIANGGKHYLPQIIEKITSPDGLVTKEFKPKIIDEIKGHQHHFALIREAMKEVVHGRWGTARKVRIEHLTIGGKTGTAQVVGVARYQHYASEDDIPYRLRDHAWFTCFAPVENPEIAVTVMVEHGLHGGSVAGPVARAVLEKYFSWQLAAAKAEAKNDQKADN
ncbi:MAG: penicillin-binding protein 2 [Deltaproteobacteria bacterium]|nr:MAG: penicillin-binding protein 2 [Deltaproteobacteria bacterium]